jgi:hypothetical protein
MDLRGSYPMAEDQLWTYRSTRGPKKQVRATNLPQSMERIAVDGWRRTQLCVFVGPAGCGTWAGVDSGRGRR